MDSAPDPGLALIALLLTILVYSCIFSSSRFWWNRCKYLKLVRDGVEVQGKFINILTRCSCIRNDGTRVFHEFEYKTHDIMNNEYSVRKCIEFNDGVQRRWPQPGDDITVVVLEQDPRSGVPRYMLDIQQRDYEDRCHMTAATIGSVIGIVTILPGFLSLVSLAVICLIHLPFVFCCSAEYAHATRCLPSARIVYHHQQQQEEEEEPQLPAREKKKKGEYTLVDGDSNATATTEIV
eukprot:CAMPEP_0116542332 /NCGR_PEP_ID=MMETSP0397-20121206/960_1 /TAXON_ID=216820 /ORGANISM="Cyclophora tenuis, Strain ECT3854" /LENGTH=235 /DNA_ID=CAMNT_0004066335 /DNA_START=28 /DNA_END=735 /DNA_ORIENTATION=-